MEFKGTKGKWHACCMSSEPHYIFAQENEVTICKPYKEQEMRENLSLDEYRANALLISKAPEMIEMLIYFNICLKENRMPNKYSLEKLIKEATEL